MGKTCKIDEQVNMTDQETKSAGGKKKLSTRSIAMIIMAAILIVAIIAVAVALIVVSEFNVSRKEADNFVYSLANGQATILEYTGEDVNVTIPDELGGRPVVGIAERAFYKNSEISSITIESDAANFTIGAYAFADMDSLISVVLPDGVKSIPERAFSGCDDLSRVTMGNAVEEIGAYAFSECPTLANIFISKSSGGMGDEDTDYNTRYNMTMPSSLKTIGDFAFYQSITASAASTRKIAFNSALTSIGQSAFDGCNRISFIDYANPEETVSLAEIGNNAFYGCTSLRFTKNTTGGASGEFFLTKALNDRVLESIGDNAFYGCTYGSTSTSNRAVLNIYEDTEYIGENAFYNVKSVKELNFYSCNPELGEGAFYGTANLTSVNYYEEKKDAEGNVEEDENGNVVYVKSTVTSLSPSLTSIPSRLFYGSGLDGFLLGSTVTEIGDGAFSAITNEEAITIVGGEEDDNGNIIGEKFALYKLAPYYTLSSTTASNYTVANDHYLLMSADLSTIYAYVGGFSDSASPVRNDKVGQASNGFFTFLQNQTIGMTTVKGYAFAGAQYSYIYFPDKLNTFGDNMFNGASVSSEKTMVITFENTTEGYYDALLSGNLSKEFLSGMEVKDGGSIVVLVGLSSLGEDLKSDLESYFTYTNYEVSRR